MTEKKYTTKPFESIVEMMISHKKKENVIFTYKKQKSKNDKPKIMNGKNEMKLMIDNTFKEALKLWFYNGIYPGSWTIALIIKDYETCIFNAHPLILPHLKDHLIYVDEYLPIEAKDIQKWEGFNRLSEDEKIKIKKPNPALC